MSKDGYNNRRKQAHKELPTDQIIKKYAQLKAQRDLKRKQLAEPNQLWD